jgi:hypothetical protein
LVQHNPNHLLSLPPSFLFHKICGLVGIDPWDPFIHKHVQRLYGLVMLFTTVIKFAKAFNAQDLNGFEINVFDID